MDLPQEVLKDVLYNGPYYGEDMNIICIFLISAVGAFVARCFSRDIEYFCQKGEQKRIERTFTRLGMNLYCWSILSFIVGRGISELGVIAVGSYLWAAILISLSMEEVIWKKLRRFKSSKKGRYV